MAICIVVTKANLGGAQRYVESLARLLASDGVSTTVVVGEGKELLARLAAIEVELVQFPALSNRSIVADFKLFMWLVRHFRRRKFDKIVFNSTKVLPVAWALSFFLPPNSILFVCHGFPFIPGVSSRISTLKAALYFALLRRIQTVICVSQFVKTLVTQNTGNGCNIVLARNTIEPSVAFQLGYDVATIACSSAETLAAEVGGGVKGVGSVSSIPASSRCARARHGPAFRVASLAELNRNKGIDALCLSLAPYREQLDGKFEWHIFGDGADRCLIQKLIDDSGLVGMVFLHGFREDARDRLREYDALLLPSRNEAFGMVALEAAASGVFVLGLDVGGVPEAILSPDFGRVYGTSGELAAVLVSLAAGKEQLNAPAPPPLAYWEKRYREWADIHLSELRR